MSDENEVPPAPPAAPESPAAPALSSEAELSPSAPANPAHETSGDTEGVGDTARESHAQVDRAHDGKPPHADIGTPFPEGGGAHKIEVNPDGSVRNQIWIGKDHIDLPNIDSDPAFEEDLVDEPDDD